MSRKRKSMKQPTSSPHRQLVPREVIEQRILLIRGHKVMLDSSLAELYGVDTSHLNKAVKRNLERFPSDFMFQLTRQEEAALRFHFGISNGRRGGRRYLPYVFTELGVAMLSSVLHTRRAVHVNIAIMRTFARLRAILAHNKQLTRKLEELEKKCNVQFQIVFEELAGLKQPPPLPPKRPIGFLARHDN